ncbi:MAG: peptidoglycan-binding protein, partial [Pseudomonadota bacterium]
GMLLPRQGTSAQALPEDVQFSLDAAQIAGLLAEQGVVPAQTGAGEALSSVALSRKAADMAVLVSCW